jgi:hypothetical protein
MKPVKDIRAIIENLKKNEMPIKIMGRKNSMKKLNPHFFPQAICLGKYDSLHLSKCNSLPIAIPFFGSFFVSFTL